MIINFLLTVQVGTEKGGFQTVLEQRRANNILIEIKRFPAARHIKAAILSMDYSYFNKEIVEVRQGLLGQGYIVSTAELLAEIFLSIVYCTTSIKYVGQVLSAYPFVTPHATQRDLKCLHMINSPGLNNNQ